MQDLLSKLYLLPYKAPLRATKGDLPTAARRSDFIDVSLCERVSGNLGHPDNPVTMNRRTKRIEIRLTEDEATFIKEKSSSYSSVGHYIRSAIAEYSDINAKQKLQLLNDLGEFYQKFQNELSWAGGNLNQSAKRANELSVAGLLSGTYISEVLMPAISDVQKTLDTMKRELLIVTKKATKL